MHGLNAKPNALQFLAGLQERTRTSQIVRRGICSMLFGVRVWDLPVQS